MQLDEKAIQEAIVNRAADEVLGSVDMHKMVAQEVNARIDAIFKDRVAPMVQEAVDEAVKNSFEREYQRVNNFGQPVGEKTSIRKELDALVGSFWQTKVNKRNGQPESGNYDTVTRAEYLMAQICAEDFTKTMKTHAANVTGALKDGLRVQLAKHMDSMLNDLFHIKSLQDQGKVEKPY